MPPPRRPPMPKLPPFALAASRPARKLPYHLVIFFFLFALPLFAIHVGLLTLPFYWDEQGQFIPTALDLLRTGAWVAHSTIPNVHPPGVEAYLVLWYKLFGFSIPITRLAMLLIAAAGLLIAFLLAIELSRGTEGFPAFLPPLFLLASPLFYTQSMMAQLDMPAMALTLLALLLFVRKNYLVAAVASVFLVLVKETGIIVPFVFFLALIFRKDFRRAAFFIAPAVALAAWLLVLHRATGYWLGDPGFAHYNVGYALHPVRMALSFVRRIYYVFLGEFRWIGTLALLMTFRKHSIFNQFSWRVVIAVGAATLVLVSIFGGAELERYVLPVLPLFYIAVAIALMYVPKWITITATAILTAGLIANLFWNPPWPFPYENNYAMVDFVRLQQLGAGFAERNLADRTIATAWPYTAAFQDPDYGFVQRKLDVVETRDFHASSIRALPPRTFDALITFTRTWAPENFVMSNSLVRRFLAHFYDWAPDITPEQCMKLGLRETVSWDLRGQEITIYIRKGSAPANQARLHN
ncbi:MAG: glycosyltransferase family 39 protein, partial [Acidobacteriaceae bacterium]|nr:glycosyltransferase family 39 protein [Acidobacteriaceae bacterium]